MSYTPCWYWLSVFLINRESLLDVLLHLVHAHLLLEGLHDYFVHCLRPLSSKRGAWAVAICAFNLLMVVVASATALRQHVNRCLHVRDANPSGFLWGKPDSLST